MERKLFYEFEPKRGEKQDKAVLFSSGFGATNDVLGVKKSFKSFDLDFYSFARNDELIAEKFGGIEAVFKAFCKFIQEIDKKGYDEFILFGKSFGGFLQLLAMQKLAKQEIRTRIKIVCAPAFLDLLQLVEEGNIILPDGKTSIEIDESNKQFLINNVLKTVSHDTLLIIGENDEAQDLDALKVLHEQNKDKAKLEIIPNRNHFDLLEDFTALHKIMKFLRDDITVNNKQ